MGGRTGELDGLMWKVDWRREVLFKVLFFVS